MPIAGLDRRIDVWFTEDAQYFYIRMPYCKETFEMLDCYSMAGVWREWDADIKARKFRAEDYYDIMELLHQYFPMQDISSVLSSFIEEVF